MDPANARGKLRTAGLFQQHYSFPSAARALLPLHRSSIQLCNASEHPRSHTVALTNEAMILVAQSRANRPSRSPLTHLTPAPALDAKMTPKSPRIAAHHDRQRQPGMGRLTGYTEILDMPGKLLLGV